MCIPWLHRAQVCILSKKVDFAEDWRLLFLLRSFEANIATTGTLFFYLQLRYKGLDDVWYLHNILTSTENRLWCPAYPSKTWKHSGKYQYTTSRFYTLSLCMITECDYIYLLTFNFYSYLITFDIRLHDIVI